MAKSASSKRWLREHAADRYVQRAAAEGYRSRAAYKLLELDARDRIFRAGARVVDLGAAPGGWSQVAAAATGPGGRVVACDLLAMRAIARVSFVQGDFADAGVLAALVAALPAGRADLVISDMAPNMSGMKAIDQPRIMSLAELALDCAERVLEPGGALVVKVFQGEGFEAFLALVRARFAQVAIRKPAASRGRSPELYMVARGYGV
ncbi:MAG: 23S rRNA (uridine(2552)-2'-O)-methyltransferase RlmE [Gammaproteobacteria bacterium]|nr:23S rRNA (uridine(2552)-2'-O)-methyltransferase RlmE [Gammaproteobacteria bacterium]